ncbi:hypothetical protein ACF3NX_02375 [Acetobacter orientalis]
MVIATEKKEVTHPRLVIGPMPEFYHALTHYSRLWCRYIMLEHHRL